MSRGQRERTLSMTLSFENGGMNRNDVLLIRNGDGDKRGHFVARYALTECG